MVSKIQSVMFNRKVWNTEMARKWLEKNKKKPIKKVDKTKNWLRYRLKSPGQFKRFRIKNIEKFSIKLVLGFRK